MRHNRCEATLPGLERQAQPIHPDLCLVWQPLPGFPPLQGQEADGRHPGQELWLRLRWLHNQGHQRLPDELDPARGAREDSHRRGVGLLQALPPARGKRKLAEAIKAQAGTQAEDLDAARDRVCEEQIRLDSTINNLLDNLTESNREFVDKRLNGRRDQRDQLKLRDEELECLELAQSSIDATVQEAMDFIKKLEFTLREGVPQEKLVALRQCVERVCINRRKATINLLIRQIPAGPQGQVVELTIQLGTKCLTETEQQRTRPSTDTPKDG